MRVLAPDRVRRLAPAFGWMLAAVLLAFSAAVGGVAVAQTLQHVAGIPLALSFGLVPALMIVAFGPYWLVPFAAFENKPDALARGEAAAGALGALPAAAAGAFFVTASALSVLADTRPWWAAGVGVALVVLAAPLLSARCARAYVEGATAPIPLRVSPRIGALLSALAGAFALVATLACMLRPLPLIEGRIPDETAPLEHVLAGTSLRIRPVAEGLHIEATDGGGAGFVAWSRPVRSLRGVRRGDELEIWASSGTHAASTRIDMQGVRRDDGFGRRLSDRLGVPGAILWAAALLLLVVVLRVPVARGPMRALLTLTLLSAAASALLHL